jgi:hypothetical protein
MSKTITEIYVEDLVNSAKSLISIYEKNPFMDVEAFKQNWLDKLLINPTEENFNHWVKTITGSPFKDCDLIENGVIVAKVPKILVSSSTFYNSGFDIGGYVSSIKAARASSPWRVIKLYNNLVDGLQGEEKTNAGEWDKLAAYFNISLFNGTQTKKEEGTPPGELYEFEPI